MQNINIPDQSTRISLSSLLCEENEPGINSLSEDFNHDNYNDDYYDHLIFAVSECQDDDYVEILLSREINSNLIRNREVSNTLRNDAVNYILNMRAALGFQLQTVYLSLTYFDLFLSKRSIDDGTTWAIQLLSVACLSLAAKLEEYKVPSLSDFQVDSYNFEGKIIQRMELLVLNTLEWKMGLVTPFAYLPCFIKKFCHVPPTKGTISRIIKLLLALVREINLMDHHSYAIACASILVVLDQRLSRKAMEMMINNIPSSKNLDMEDIFTCYNIMKQLELKKNVVPNLPDSRALSPIDVLIDSPASSSLNTTRKRLEFDNIDDTNDDLCEKRRHC